MMVGPWWSGGEGSAEDVLVDFHLIWKDQCEAARAIKEEFGREKALGYLIGEKLVNFVRAADERPEFREELPKFLDEVKDIFEEWEIRDYLDNVKRIGALGHICSEEEYRVFREAGAIGDDIVTGAENVLIMARIREWLLGE